MTKTPAEVGYRIGSKGNPSLHDGYQKALPGEPVFTLLARDKLGPTFVEDWADARLLQVQSGDAPKEDIELIMEARRIARSMREWRAANEGVWRPAWGAETKIMDAEGQAREDG